MPDQVAFFLVGFSLDLRTSVGCHEAPEGALRGKVFLKFKEFRTGNHSRFRGSLCSGSKSISEADRRRLASDCSRGLGSVRNFNVGPRIDLTPFAIPTHT
jgi:hypothetical protein